MNFESIIRKLRMSRGEGNKGPEGFKIEWLFEATANPKLLTIYFVSSFSIKKDNLPTAKGDQRYQRRPKELYS